MRRQVREADDSEVACGHSLARGLLSQVFVEDERLLGVDCRAGLPQGRCLMRMSIQAYNDEGDVAALLRALEQLIPGPARIG